MKRYKKIITFLIVFLVFMSAKSVNAYGFGLKKNTNHTQPDIGIYKAIIEKNNGLYVGNKDSKDIYLTFDCGYENGYTKNILDVLKEKNVKATFFITGHYLKSATDLVKRMIDEGHVVANHSYHHKNITKITDDEIKKEIVDLEEEYKRLTGKELTKFYRPPAGNFDDHSLGIVNKLGYKTMFWSVAYPDWLESNDVTRAVNEVTKNIHNGAIILLHAVSNANSEALRVIIDKLQNQGYIIQTSLKLM